MSRFATLPNARRVDRVENGIAYALEDGAYIDVSAAHAIYADDKDVVVEFTRNSFRFLMATRADAKAGVTTLLRAGLDGQVR